MFSSFFVHMVQRNLPSRSAYCSESGHWSSEIFSFNKQPSDCWISEALNVWLVDVMYCSGSSLTLAFANLVLCSCLSSSSHSGSSASSFCSLQDSYKTHRKHIGEEGDAFLKPSNCFRISNKLIYLLTCHSVWESDDCPSDDLTVFNGSFRCIQISHSAGQ